MKPFLPILTALALAAPLVAEEPTAPAPSASPAPVLDDASARSAALELAGAFSNDGYKIRDGYYFTQLAPGQSAVVEVNLFAGNEYWFCAAGVDAARKVAVQVFGEDGKPIAQQDYEDGPRGAAGVVAAASGKYLVRITLAEGEKSPVCFLYCYK